MHNFLEIYEPTLFALQFLNRQQRENTFSLYCCASMKDKYKNWELFYFL